jgi:hypothetical protein
MSPFFRDAAERVISTYLQVFLGLLITSGVTDVSAVQAAALAAVPAALSALKAVIAKRFGDPDSAGF